MEVKTRAKRYEDLRKSVEDQDTTTSTHEKILQDLKNTEIKNDDYTPTHQKNNGTNNVAVENTDEFKNEYLDSFIQEVREYNIQKGTRESDDTKLDILQQLSSKQRMKRAAYMEKMENEDSSPESDETFSDNIFALAQDIDALKEAKVQVLKEEETTNFDHEDKMSSTQEIAQQVQELLNEEASTPVEKTVDEENTAYEEPFVEEIQPSISNDIEDTTTGIDLEEISRDELIEKTQQLKVQLDEYEGELTSLSSDLNKNNRLLNIIIGVLILMLLAVIGVVVYWLISGGII